MKQNNLEALFSALSDGLSAEEFQLSVLQGQIAAEIAMQRQKLGLSQKELAARLGVTQGLVSRWEKGETNFTLSKLVEIASALELKMQSPIVPSPPIPYPIGNSNIYRLNCTTGWSTNAYRPDPPTATSTETEQELLEM